MRRTTTIERVLTEGNFDLLCDLRGWNHYHCEELRPTDTVVLTEAEWVLVFSRSM